MRSKDALVIRPRSDGRAFVSCSLSCSDNRMNAAVLEIFGNSKEEAIYPAYYVDADRRKTDGTNRYILRFANDQLPPV